MPVDDLLVWAAETPSHGLGRSKKISSTVSLDSPETYTRPTVDRPPPSPPPSTPNRRQLPRWYEIGHCAAACSGRCSLHAASQEQPNVITNADTSEQDVAEAFPTQGRSHHRRSSGRPTFQTKDSQNVRLSLSAKPKISERRYRNSQLEQAREALLNGNVIVARAIVSAEMERLLSKGEGK